MKKLSIILSVFCLTAVFGQKVSDFKYVLVPDSFQTFKDNYGLENFLIKSLKGKKYIVIPKEKDKWPSEVSDNPCNIINADVLNDSSFLRNKILLQFKDCNDKIIFSSKGSSNIKEFVEGYTEALQQSLVALPASNPTVINITQTNPVKESKETINNVSENPPTTASDKKTNKYSNGKLNLQKIQIEKNQFILADPDSSVPYATFKATDKKDVFRVKLANGESTLGYFEGENIVIEIPQPDGEYSKEIFSAKK